jgi:hypothetical protein
MNAGISPKGHAITRRADSSTQVFPREAKEAKGEKETMGAKQAKEAKEAKEAADQILKTGHLLRAAQCGN